MKLILITLAFSVQNFFIFAQVLADGTLIRAYNTPEIYLVINQHLHHIPDMDVFRSLYVNSPEIQNMNAIALELLPMGDPLVKGRLVMASNSAVFLQYDRVKVHVPNPETFNVYGFAWNKVIKLGDDEIQKYKTLSPITSIEKSIICNEPKPCGTHD